MTPFKRKTIAFLSYMAYFMMGCMFEDILDSIREEESTNLITLRIVMLSLVVALQWIAHRMKKLGRYLELKSKRLKYQMRRERRKAEARKHCSIRENGLYGP